MEEETYFSTSLKRPADPEKTEKGKLIVYVIFLSLKLCTTSLRNGPDKNDGNNGNDHVGIGHLH